MRILLTLTRIQLLRSSIYWKLIRFFIPIRTFYVSVRKWISSQMFHKFIIKFFNYLLCSIVLMVLKASLSILPCSTIFLSCSIILIFCSSFIFACCSNLVHAKSKWRCMPDFAWSSVLFLGNWKHKQTASTAGPWSSAYQSKHSETR